MHVPWDEGASANPYDLLVLLTGFIAATKVFGQRVSKCPLQYRSGNAQGERVGHAKAGDAGRAGQLPALSVAL